jgi:surface antigen
MTGAFALLICLWWAATNLNWNPRFRVGQAVDNLDGVLVFHNGGVAHSSGRNLAPDGYNLGINYQCVEFVKRYYYEHLNHKMPDSYGHAKQFFDPALADGALNTHRDLLQYVNGSEVKPRPGDLLVMGPSALNRYGHVAIVSEVTGSDIEIVQQNPGPFGPSRERISLVLKGECWRLDNRRVLGWLRKAPNQVPGSD